MRIGVELRYIVAGHAGGIVPLLKGLLEAVFEKYPEHQFFVFCTIYNRNLLKAGWKHVDFLTLSQGAYWQELDQICSDRGIDVLFRSYPADDSLSFPMSKQIVMIPDIQHEFYPEFFTKEVIHARRRSFNRALVEAGAICTISDYAKKTLDEYEWTRCKDIFLACPALQTDYEQKRAIHLSEAEEALLPKKEFFLFPANLWPHKNHVRVLKAFDLF